MIPYKNWQNQNKYSVYGWPSDVLFADYVNLNEHDKIKILNALNDIYFVENQNV